MAKALKTVAAIAGIAAIAVATAGAGLAVAAGFSVGAGLSAVAGFTTPLLLAAAAGSVGATLLAGTPQVPNSQSDRLRASIDPRAFRKDVFGSTALATDVRYEEWSGDDQDYCDWIICLASHRIHSVDAFWINDELAWTATGGAQGRYVGYLTLPNVILEGTPGNAFTFASGQWNAAEHRLTGCAYLRARFKVTGNGKKAESPFASGPPSRITIVGRGGMLYDPRRDSTVPGGAGPMRAADQSTWRYVADDGGEIGENLPLIILRRRLGWRIANPTTGALKLATGAGMPAKRLDLASFAAAANAADELVARAAGGTEPRFRGAGVISEGDDPKAIDEALCAACGGRFLDVGGRISLQLALNDLAEAALDEGLRDDDVVGGFAWDPDPALDQTPNVVRGRYVDASDASLYQLVDYPEIRVASADGIDRVLPLDLGFVESASQAQRLGRQKLQRRQGLRRFSAPFDIRAWSWPVGKVVPFTFGPLGFQRALFRVAEQAIGRDGRCEMVLEAESPLFYQWDGDDRAPVQAVAAGGYDPLKDPLLQALGQRGAYTIRSSTPAYRLTSDNVSVSVVAFDGVLDDGQAMSFVAATLPATESTEYAVFWDLEADAYELTAQGPSAQLQSARFVWIGDIATLNAEGEAPPSETPPPGGGGYGPRNPIP